LTLLGVVAHHTPEAASQIAQTATALSSFSEAAALLAQRGRCIDIKTVRSLAYHFSHNARLKQQSLVMNPSADLDGKRCAVSVDGGRIRTRSIKRGRKTKKNRHRFKTDWREPKLLHICIIGTDGKMCRHFAPWIDGTLNGADAVFLLLSYYLRALNITGADQILFIADGAHWIWNRIPWLIDSLHLDPNRVYQLVDYYHAVEHLTTVASLCKKRWTAKKRRQWVSRLKGFLWNGKVDEVVKAVEDVTRGRNSKKIVRERNYFFHNVDRMSYAKAREQHLPVGSGPMESAIRRVINLRMKGCGIFWKEQNAEAMIMLRSFYKAGRWENLVILATEQGNNGII